VGASRLCAHAAAALAQALRIGRTCRRCGSGGRDDPARPCCFRKHPDAGPARWGSSSGDRFPVAFDLSHGGSGTLQGAFADILRGTRMFRVAQALLTSARRALPAVPEKEDGPRSRRRSKGGAGRSSFIDAREIFLELEFCEFDRVIGMLPPREASRSAPEPRPQARADSAAGRKAGR